VGLLYIILVFLEMSSFWETKPVGGGSIDSQYHKSILTLSELSHKIDQELANSTFRVPYTILSGDDEEGQKRALGFINEYYVTSQYDVSGGSDNKSFRYHYSEALWRWYIRDALVLEFTSKDAPIGYIVGRKTCLSIACRSEPLPAIARLPTQLRCSGIRPNQEHVWDSFEVSFLCVLPRLRSMGLCSYMINALTREVCLRGNCIAHYTISSAIKSPHYCEKVLYCADTTRPTTGLCAGYQYTVTEYYTKKTPPSSVLIQSLYDMYRNYTKSTYRIFEEKTLAEFEGTFLNEMFHHFIVRHVDNHIVAYICMYRLDIHDIHVGHHYRTGNYYMVAFEDKEQIPLYTEFVNQYIRAHGIFDMVMFLDMFESRHYDAMSFQRCDDSKVRYYLYNRAISRMNPWECGLVTI
jgi:Myristoyl-CoA:protein N-myristoyltransferase, N-terminal domain